jgi:hypothetical protein
MPIPARVCASLEIVTVRASHSPSSATMFPKTRTHEPVSPRLQEQQRRERDIHRVIAELVRLHKQNLAQAERRQEDRIDFIQPVQVRLENQRVLKLLSRDLSKAGIRLIATESLLGQKLLVSVPRPDDGEPANFSVRILWTCSIGDGLFENGGSFLEFLPSSNDE